VGHRREGKLARGRAERDVVQGGEKGADDSAKAFLSGCSGENSEGGSGMGVGTPRGSGWEGPGRRPRPAGGRHQPKSGGHGLACGAAAQNKGGRSR
jgi:hypothetical protein